MQRSGCRGPDAEALIVLYTGFLPDFDKCGQIGQPGVSLNTHRDFILQKWELRKSIYEPPESKKARWQ